MLLVLHVLVMVENAEITVKRFVMVKDVWTTHNLWQLQVKELFKGS